MPVDVMMMVMIVGMRGGNGLIGQPAADIGDLA